MSAIVSLVLLRDWAHSTAQWMNQSYFRSFVLENPQNHSKILPHYALLSNDSCYKSRKFIHKLYTSKKTK